jgi:hypothetical protein
LTYFCFIELRALSVPHMEPLLADDRESALNEARSLMARHASAVAAHIYLDDALVGTVRLDPDATAGEADIPDDVRSSGTAG